MPRPREERVREGKTRDLAEPVLVSGRPGELEVLEPPMPLGKDAEAWWDEVVPMLAEAGLIDRVDVYVLAMAANAWADVVKAQRVLSEDGLFQMGSVGQVVPHAATRIKRDAMLTFERLVNHLALSPVARTRLGLTMLHGRALAREMDEMLGREVPEADAEVIDDADVGLPGV